MKNDTQHSHKFDIHSSIVFRLGEELITDDVQALIELVKNSWDADASYCKIDINTRKKLSKEESQIFSGSQGVIEITDDGFGMDSQTIERGWLTISNSLKKDMKDKGQTTSKGRIPLGDKGLGRLATQRLGNNIEIYTYPKKGKHGYYVAFSWMDFSKVTKLEKVGIIVEKISFKEKGGTKIVISDLQDPETWKKLNKTKLSELQTRLSTFISPYKKIKGFNVALKINGSIYNPRIISEKIRDTAHIRYTIDFNDKREFVIEGKMCLSYLRPDNPKKRKLFEEFIQNDEGKSFFEFMKNEKKYSNFGFELSDGGKWFIHFRIVRQWKDFDKLKTEQSNIAYPGPFDGEIDYFNFDIGSEEQNVFNTKSEYKKHIREYSGIKVYRDGFGIRFNDRDWLELSKAQTGGGSWYNLRPENTIGYISISEKGNPKLVEITNRQGFKESPHYLNFRKLLIYFVGQANKSQEFIRRSENKYLNKRKKEFETGDEDTSSDDIISDVIEKSTRISDVTGKISTLIKDLESVHDSLETFNNSLRSSLLIDPNMSSEITAPLKKIEGQITDNSKSLSNIRDSLEDVSGISEGLEIIKMEIEQDEEKMSLLYEAASLGITAEALHHEINNIADRLHSHSLETYQHLKSVKINDPKLNSYFEYIKSSISAIRKQISHLSPALRYVREKKELIDMNEFCKNEMSYYNQRWINKEIVLETKLEKKPFIVNINRGKLTQIFDNIIQNSEYWLKEDLRIEALKKGIITIELKSPDIYIYDNGRGIEKFVENSLFEQFITTKGEGKGRGLGLFIVSQFLESEGCYIELLNERNQHGKRYIFKIDLTGCLNE